MIKNLILFLLFVSSVCTQNKIINDEKTDKPMLIGECSLEAFQDTSFAWWYNSEFNNYEPNKNILDSLKNKNISNYEIDIILGSWCSDSRREIPRFIKILDLSDYDLEKINLYAVDRKKFSPDGNINSKNIELVPTFIIMKNGTEIGKIIETPINTLEEDLFDIMKLANKK